MEKVVGKAWWVYKVKIVWSLLEADEKLLEEVNIKDRLENIIKSILEEEWKAGRKTVDSVMEVGEPDSISVEMLAGPLYTWHSGLSPPGNVPDDNWSL